VLQTDLRSHKRFRVFDVQTRNSPRAIDTRGPQSAVRAEASPAPQIEAVIRRADFQITYVLDGQSENGTMVHLISKPQLAFLPSVRLGSRVSEGKRVGRTIVEPRVRTALGTGASTSRLEKSQLAQLRELTGAVAAPISGVFGKSAGRPVVQAPGIDVVVDLLPIQYLRYQSLEFSGQAIIETVIGQRQVSCAAVWVQPSQPSASGGPYELRCRLPGHVETAAGLRAQVKLKSALYEDVVVVPNVYVGYDEATDGYFITVIENGSERRLPITVGVTDGVVRIVTSKVPVGAKLVPF
jgi:hypothetical protein